MKQNILELFVEDTVDYGVYSGIKGCKDPNSSIQNWNTKNSKNTPKFGFYNPCQQKGNC